MDSGNSSSMQSSGGGDDQEFNSHASDSVSGFLNPSFSHFLPTSNPQSSFLSPHHLPTFLDNPTSSHILQASFSQSQTQASLNKNSLLSLDSVQSHQPNMSQFQGSSSMQAQSTGLTVQLGDATRASGSSDHQTRVVRNTKKRTRASRRAPTTVMTTDTTNFRAMVQEFTGIPEPPFSGSSRRLDLFGFGSAAPILRSANHLEPMGTLFPARSLSHNVQSFANPIANFPNSASTTNTFDLYQHSSDLSNMPKQAQDMLSMQNQNQTFVQSSVLSSLNVASFGTAKSQLGSAATFMNQEFGVSHGHDNAGFSGMQSHADGSYNGNQDHQLRSFSENYAAEAQCNNSCNLNYNASPSDGKNLDNVTSGAERTAESWIFR